MKLTPRIRPLVAAVRAHAAEHYINGGWDVIVECYDDAAIAEVIGSARTVDGALARFRPIIEVLADRQAEAAYQIREAVGDPSSASSHYRTGGEYSYDRPGCGCGAAFATDKAADLHVAKVTQAAGTYDPRAQGHHPDGSFVSWRHDEHSGEAWATRTWSGKVGRASIEITETREGYEVVESYTPGWRGQIIDTPDYCGHRGKRSPGCWDCGGSSCNTKAHPECEPPF